MRADELEQKLLEVERALEVRLELHCTVSWSYWSDVAGEEC